MSRAELRNTNWNDEEEGVEMLMKHFDMSEYFARLSMKVHLTPEPERSHIMEQMRIYQSVHAERMANG